MNNRPWYFWAAIVVAGIGLAVGATVGIGVLVYVTAPIWMPAVNLIVTSASAVVGGIAVIAYSYFEDQKKIALFNNMDLATLQSQPLDQLLQLANGKSIANWLDQAHTQMLSNAQLTGAVSGELLINQLDADHTGYLTGAQLSSTSDGKSLASQLDVEHRAYRLSAESKSLPSEFQSFLGTATLDNDFMFFTEIDISIQKGNSHVSVGQIESDTNKFITLYQKYKSEINAKPENFLLLTSTYKNLYNLAIQSKYAIVLSKLGSTSQRIFDWMGNVHTAMKTTAENPGNSTDVAAYCDTISDQLANQMGNFDIFQNNMSDLTSQLDSLKNIEYPDAVVQWALDGSSINASSAGGLTYTSSKSLTMREAATLALKNLFMDADNFVTKANKGIAKVVENKRISDIKDLMSKIFDIASSVVTIGIGLTKTIISTSEATIKLALEASSTFAGASNTIKNQTNNWLKPDNNRYRGGFSNNAYLNLNTQLQDFSNFYTFDTELKNAMANFSSDYKKLIKTIDNNISKTEVQIGFIPDLNENSPNHYDSEVNIDNKNYYLTLNNNTGDHPRGGTLHPVSLNMTESIPGYLSARVVLYYFERTYSARIYGSNPTF